MLTIKQTSELVQYINIASEQHDIWTSQISFGLEQIKEAIQQTAFSLVELASSSEMLKEHFVQ